ncbi:MAG: UvrD-helicase domain-containing protein [Spirochaetales bacterium]|nr:UvrD-helicase domain-containing protein [Spirochaetales bacterium]
MIAEKAAKRVEDLSEEQRKAARARRNVVVAAGAGSGKTTVLAARYVDLVETGRMPDGSRVHARNVLALTFTNKARSEMYGRIFAALLDAANRARDEGDGGLAAHLEDCVERFGQARIVTFDSFAGDVARQGAYRFGLAPDFALDDDEAGRLAEEEALAFALERRTDPSLRALVAANGFGGAVERLLADLALRRLTLADEPGFSAMPARIEARLKTRLAGLADFLADEAADAAAADDGDARKSVRRVAEALAPFSVVPPEPWAPDPSREAALETCLALKKPASNLEGSLAEHLSDRWTEIKDAAKDSLETLAAIRELPVLEAVYRLLDEFSSRALAARRAAGVVTFRDVAAMARRLLVEDPPLRQLLKERYRYVMVDEFQDDDELQKDILFLLAERLGRFEPGMPQAEDLEPDKLFFVGDEKQSIYLFRGADVSVFRGLSDELGRCSPHGPESDGDRLVQLRSNWRSEPALVSFFNAVFGALMAGATSPHEARFEPLVARAPIAGASSGVEWHELARDGELDGYLPRAEVEAWAVAEWIRDAVADPSFMVADRETGKARRAEWEDFAILERSTTAQALIEKYLRMLGVPYAPESVCGLFSEAPASDLLLALTLAARPADRRAYAAFLRSPFARLSDDAFVEALASGSERADGRFDYGEAFDAPPEAISDPADRERYVFARETWLALRAMAGTATLARALSYLWYERGYRAALLASPGARAFEEHFEALYALAVQADRAGLDAPAFTAAWEGELGSVRKLDEAAYQREETKGVRIMTIHKAKGLEFPVAIVVDLANSGRNETAGSWNAGRDGLVTLKLAPGEEDPKRRRDILFAAGKDERDARRAAELKRLFYVACTRAETRLVFFSRAPGRASTSSFRALLCSALEPLGAADFPGPGEVLGHPAGIALKAMRDRVEDDYRALLGGSSARGAGKAPGPDALLEAAREASRRAYAAAPAFSSVTALAHAAVRAGAARSDPSGPGTGLEPLPVDKAHAEPPGFPPDAWGTLVHAILERALSPDAKDADAPFPPAVEAALGEGEPRGQALSRANALASTFLSSPLGQRAAAARERETELRLLVRLDDGTAARGVADLVFVEEGPDGGRHAVLVDYKTDRSLDPVRHEAQLSCYREAVAGIYGLECEAWIFYLHGGGRAVPVLAPAVLTASGSPAPEPRRFGFGPRGPDKVLEDDELRELGMEA